MSDEETIYIDGSYGEGGGQILRSALSLSLLLKKPFKMANIRSGRGNPGLQAQHLTAVRACSKISNAKTKGADVGSTGIEFCPLNLASSDLKFDTGTAASTSLIFQCLAPALLFSGKGSSIELIGGTNNPLAPSVLYLQHIFLRMASKLGINISLTVDKYGWYPKGGGILRSEITPLKKLGNMRIEDRGKIQKLWGIALTSNLPTHIAVREKEQCMKKLLGFEHNLNPQIDIIEASSMGQGTELFVCAEYENSMAGFTSLGEIGKPAERLADEACNELTKFHDSRMSIDSHLGDQILLYLALAEGKSWFTTSSISNHLITNAWLIKQFLPDVVITIEGQNGEKGKVTVDGIGFVNENI